MAEFSKISWTHGTFNPWIGCSRRSPGCQNCYAENLMANRYGRVEWGPGKPRSRTKTWNEPVKWDRQAAEAGVRKRVFCASLADWLDEEIDEAWRNDLFRLIERCRNIDWLMLTKRPENALEMLPDAWLLNPLPHVWFGVTGEDAEWYKKRTEILAKIPAALKWVSYEPSLGPIDKEIQLGPQIDWLIIGGESDQVSPARRFDLEWAEDAIEACRIYSVLPFVKQVGANAFYKGKPFLVKDKAGTDPDEWPEGIRVREFPTSPAAVQA